MTDAPLVVVRTYFDRVEAELAHSALEAAGIDSVVRGDDAGGLRPDLSMTRGVAVLVREEDVDEADDVLGAAEPGGGYS